MKKKLLGISCLCSAAFLLSSCYSSTVCVGDIKKNDPAVKVNTVHNSHFLYGLIGESKMRGKNYVDGAKNYKVKHQITFVDGLLSSLTFGIYTPSTTKFYVPLKATKKRSKNKRRNDDDDD